MDIIIDEEFRTLIPPLAEIEFNDLEKLITEHGCQNPLIYWQREAIPCDCGSQLVRETYEIVEFNNEFDKHVTNEANMWKCAECAEQLDESEMEFTLVDGHNRYEICQLFNIPFETIPMQFTNRNEAKLWIIRNQEGRRNLTDGWKYNLAQTKKVVLMDIGKVKKVEDGKKARDKQLGVLSIVDNTPEEPKHNTREVIAEDLGWSTGKVAMADRVWKEAEPEVIEKVLSNVTSINEAYQGLKNTVHVSQNSGENEWYTPEQFIEAARLTMGSIDLDPASSELANQTVKAQMIFTKEVNGLAQSWANQTIFLNPPYAQPLMNQFAEKLVTELDNIKQAIVLVNNATETKWFQSMAKAADCICFPESRIKFIDKEGKPSGAPLQGQVFLYFGGNTGGFIDNFSQFGFVMDHV